MKKERNNNLILREIQPRPYARYLPTEPFSLSRLWCRVRLLRYLIFIGHLPPLIMTFLRHGVTWRGLSNPNPSSFLLSDSLPEFRFSFKRGSIAVEKMCLGFAWLVYFYMREIILFGMACCKFSVRKSLRRTSASKVSLVYFGEMLSVWVRLSWFPGCVDVAQSASRTILLFCASCFACCRVIE